MRAQHTPRLLFPLSSLCYPPPLPPPPTLPRPWKNWRRTPAQRTRHNRRPFPKLHPWCRNLRVPVELMSSGYRSLLPRRGPWRRSDCDVLRVVVDIYIFCLATIFSGYCCGFLRGAARTGLSLLLLFEAWLLQRGRETHSLNFDELVCV